TSRWSGRRTCAVAPPTCWWWSVRRSCCWVSSRYDGFFHKTPWREKTLQRADEFLGSLQLFPGETDGQRSRPLNGESSCVFDGCLPSASSSCQSGACSLSRRLEPFRRSIPRRAYSSSESTARTAA